MLTEKQKEMLFFVHDWIGAKGDAPTYDEIKDGLAVRKQPFVGSFWDWRSVGSSFGLSATPARSRCCDCRTRRAPSWSR